MNKSLFGADNPPTRVQASSCPKVMLADLCQCIAEQKRNDQEQHYGADPETPEIVSDG